jgi:hypothetical protein
MVVKLNSKEYLISQKFKLMRLCLVKEVELLRQASDDMELRIMAL